MEIISGMELSRRMALHSFILQKNVAYDGPERFILKRRVYKLASLPENMGGFSKTVFSRFKRKKLLPYVNIPHVLTKQNNLKYILNTIWLSILSVIVAQGCKSSSFL